MHLNLLDRESQISRVDVYSDALKRHEIFEPWSVGDDVQEIFSRRELTIGDSAKVRSRDTRVLKLRTYPRELQALPLW
ncbi:hypothetical protein [Arthrobacter sp. P2b]|uniref:hypothetical protein n=1 Tax=Arthrobacter sp. P2b TaxID=1938741 RepID=UPI0009A80DAA|nr:hypothetical protein [Arthrobacter sp. P2b]SLK12622.1 hypothetical protein SAMN06272721_11717 [Arthrobacter sp. P2b]